MVVHLCYCSEIHPQSTRTRVTVVIHSREERKASNSGRLVLYALSNSALLVHGRQDLRVEGIVTPGYTPFVLHPDAVLSMDSVEFQQRESTLPVQLIIPDGNWGQAARMLKRVGELQGIPHLRLPASTSAFRLRKTWDPLRLGTMEAIAHALEILEGPEIREHCESAIQILAEKLGRPGRIRRV